MKLLAHIEIEQEIQPASFGTLRAPVQHALEDALADLVIEHPHGRAVIKGAAVNVSEALPAPKRVVGRRLV